MEKIKQSKTVDVQRGLMLVRYATADDEHRPPKVAVMVNPKDERNVELVLNPDHKQAVMWQPGSSLVVRARKPTKLLIEVAAIEDGGSTAATIKIETLTQGEASPSRMDQRARDTRSNELTGLRVLGHVAGIGDVQSGPDQWIAGPDAPARIEGISIELRDKPSDLDLRYAVRLARPHEASGRFMSLGDYAGSRGRALPIIGIALELVGPAAEKFQLSAEAAFLSAPLRRSVGRQIDLSGPTGREPLVGFRMRVEEVNIPLRPALQSEVRNKLSGRVRVFRSLNAQTELRSALQNEISTRFPTRNVAGISCLK
jgi:hypothetical protein